MKREIRRGLNWLHRILHTPTVLCHLWQTRAGFSCAKYPPLPAAPSNSSVGNDAPIAPYAPLLAKTLSLRGAERRGNPYSLRAASHHYVSVGRGDCPPSCQPVSAHCRGRQSGHFLETASLLPPPAALRRFPRPPMRCGIGKTGVAEPPPLHNFKKFLRQAPKLSVFNFPLSTYLIPRPISRFSRT